MAGADIVVKGKQHGDASNLDGVLSASVTDPVLLSYDSSISDFAYVSEKLEIELSDESRLTMESIKIYAVNPSSIVDDNLMFKYQDKDTGLGATE